MPLDAFFLAAVRRELDAAVAGMRVDKVQQPERDQLILTLRGGTSPARLLLSAGTGDARVHLTREAFDNPESPPMFCMLLRKHLTGARVKSVGQPPAERVLEIELEGSEAPGDDSTRRLIVEMTGRCPNIVLVGPDGVIVDCLRRVDMSMSEKRQVLPGLYYRLPPAQGKANPLEVGKEEWERLFAGAAGEQTAEKWIVGTFMGFSPLIAREIVSRAYGDAGLSMREVSARDGGRALCHFFFELVGDIAAGVFEPHMLLDREGRPFDFSFTRITQYGGAAADFRAESFSALLDEYYTRRFALERFRQKARALSKTAETALERLRRKLEVQRVELEATQGRERLRQLGDIVTANLHAMKKGMSVLCATDFYSEDGKKIEIPLDPRKTPQENAAKYYRDYSKAKNAEKALTEQIRLGESEERYLLSVLEEIERAESERDLAEIRRELEQTGYIKQQKSAKKEKAVALTPMRFVSSTGVEILAGRNNVQNEALTFRLARRSDIWMHAQKVPGSHVVVLSGKADVDPATLAEAASIAAWLSQARGSGKVAVDYTPVKNVRKIPGGRPGMVTYTDYRTVIAEPDEELVKRLKAR